MSLLYFKIGNDNDRQDCCCCIVFMFIYILFCSRKRQGLRQSKIWIHYQPARAISLVFFWYHIHLLVMDMLMIWLIHWVGFIYINDDLYLIKMCFQGDSWCPSWNVPFLSIGNLIFHKQTESEPWQSSGKQKSVSREVKLSHLSS